MWLKMYSIFQTKSVLKPRGDDTPPGNLLTTLQCKKSRRTFNVASIKIDAINSCSDCGMLWGPDFLFLTEI